MDLQLLGPVEATVQGRPIPLGATKQRALLAILALHVNSTVSNEFLVDALWGEEPPATAPKMVQLYVSQLRRLFDGNGAEIVTHGRGYELRLDSDSIDAARFERAVEAAGRRQRRARATRWPCGAATRSPTSPASRSRPPRSAGSRSYVCTRPSWRSSPTSAPAGTARCSASSRRSSPRTRCRERLHGQRMLALYRSGRQAEALEAYRHARRVLVEEIGVEPGPELRTLHDAILRQDGEALDRPTATAPPHMPPGDSTAYGAAVAPDGRLLVLAAALAILAGALRPSP